MDDIVERLKDQSLQLARRSFDSVDAGLAANVADAAIDEIERLREELLKHHAQRAPESIETAPRDGTPILYWDEKCAIPETVCWLNGSKIVTHGWYPYAGGNWFVDAAREKGAVWWPLPKTVTTTEHSPGCQSGDFGPCDCALTSTSNQTLEKTKGGASTYCAHCEHEHQLHEDARGFHHVIRGERVPCCSVPSTARGDT